MSERDQVAVITGAARGIGAAIAEAVVRLGGSAVLSDVEDDRGRELAEQLGDRASFCHCDVTSVDDMAVLLAHAVGHSACQPLFSRMKHGIRAMRPLRRGALVVTASVASLRGGLGPHAYTAAKHAVKG